MSVDIDGLIVDKCYTLDSGAYLGKLTAEPKIEGSGDGREMYAHFLHKDKKTAVPRWANYNAKKANRFLLVGCEQFGGRRKSRRNVKKYRRSTRVRKLKI